MSKYRILAFDGGGVRGVLSATLLKRLEDSFPGLVDKADLVAGTSIGSLIALALAFGLSPARLSEITSGIDWSAVFRRKSTGFLRPMCGGTYGIRAINSVFPPGLRLSDLSKRVLAISFRVTASGGDSWAPVFFNNFPSSETKDTSVLDVALACTAVPAYFPSHRGYIDGGVVANNPSMAALCAAVDPGLGGQSIEDVVLLSIGTGRILYRIDADTTSWGAMQWALHPSPATPLITLMVDGVSQCHTIFSRQILGERYYRLDPVLPEPVGPGDYKAVPKLLRWAEETDLSAVVSWVKRNWLD